MGQLLCPPNRRPRLQRAQPVDRRRQFEFAGQCQIARMLAAMGRQDVQAVRGDILVQPVDQFPQRFLEAFTKSPSDVTG